MREYFFSFVALILFVYPAAVPGMTLKMVGTDGSLRGTFPGVQKGEAILAELDDFFGSLEFSVDWNSSLQRLEVSRDGSTFRFRPQSQFVRTPDNRLSLSSPPVKKSGSLYVDVKSLVRLVRESSGESMIWNDARQQVQLRNPDNWSGDSEDSKETKDPIGQFIDESQETEEPDNKTMVVVDAGHGGRDPGAIGTNGLQEKRVTLDMALALRDVFREDYPGLDVRLTRDSDNFLPLQKRTQIANKLDADVFVSIHANSGFSSVAKGFEVFTLGAEASDPSAQEIAEVENSSLRYEGVSAEELDDVSWILWQLRSTIHTRESKDVAKDIIAAMDESLPGENRGVKGAPFWVLKDARMPAVLVESGFLSNPEEARRLADEAYQRKVARSIAGGIEEYVESRSNS